MPRILGVDYGTRRVGLALSDEKSAMAFPKDVIAQDAHTIESIGALCKSQDVSLIVLGLPRTFGGRESAMSEHVRAFAHELKTLGLPIEFENEIYSSREAGHGATPRAKIDAAAAAIILQSYLERKKHMVG